MNMNRGYIYCQLKFIADNMTTLYPNAVSNIEPLKAPYLLGTKHKNFLCLKVL